MDNIILQHLKKDNSKVLLSLVDFKIPFLVDEWNINFYSDVVFQHANPKNDSGNEAIFIDKNDKGFRRKAEGYLVERNSPYTIIEFFKKRELNGFSIGFKNGKIMFMCNYVNKGNDRFLVLKNQFGKISSMYNCIDEKKEGFVFEDREDYYFNVPLYENSNPFDCGYYKNGKRDGIWKVRTLGCSYPILTEYKDGVKNKNIKEFIRDTRK